MLDRSASGKQRNTFFDLWEPYYLQINTVARWSAILLYPIAESVVATIADTITVLQRGAVLAEGPYREVSQNPQVMQAYMGTTEGQLQGAHG